MVAVDLSATDTILFKTIQLLAQPLGMEKLYVVHIIPDFAMPKQLDAEFHKLFSSEYPVDERIQDKIALDIAPYLNDLPNLVVQIDVREGRPYEKLLHWAEVKEIDLLIVGHKKKSEGSGLTARRLARNTQSNLLLISDQREPKLERLLVPVDLSENACHALKTARELSQIADPTPELQTLYIVDMPPAGYYLHQYENEGFRQMLFTAAKDAYETFLDQSGVSVAPDDRLLEKNTYLNTSRHILERAQKLGTDLIVMGAKGHSRVESFIFGSVTEKLLETNQTCATLVVRQEAEEG